LPEKESFSGKLIKELGYLLHFLVVEPSLHIGLPSSMNHPVLKNISNNEFQYLPNQHVIPLQHHPHFKVNDFA
jgi:hypothetical protein